ncbi:uncharacterized protein LOC123268872 [Cotesia glomerata]|nr:uncharacterized protein LOC123268872 [Cotesia glomerata]XP_044590232.1 uncharacterized protein LOC123268872 [Cotesia glomerata]
MTVTLAEHDLSPIDIKKCKTKMEALKRHYKGLKDNNKKSGNQKITWPYYDETEELFGEQPWIKPLSTAGSNIENTMDSEVINPPSKRQKKLADYCEQLLEEKKENRAIRIQHHQEKIAATNQLTDVLRELIGHATQKRQS